MCLSCAGWGEILPFGSYHNPPFADNSRHLPLLILARERNHLAQIQVSIIKFVRGIEVSL
jgi:hypothetical protein